MRKVHGPQINTDTQAKTTIRGKQYVLVESIAKQERRQRTNPHVDESPLYKELQSRLPEVEILR